jgi:hypothetical protein
VDERYCKNGERNLWERGANVPTIKLPDLLIRLLGMFTPIAKLIGRDVGLMGDICG